jgi:hypothetical protein
MGVAQNIGAVTANITGSVAAAPPGTGATETIITRQLIGTGANQTLYTVPANKKLYVMTVTYLNEGAAGAQGSLKDNADADIVKLCAGVWGMDSWVSASPIASFAAGENVRSLSANTAYVGFSGYLVSV